jgi:hypothetical protein
MTISTPLAHDGNGLNKPYWAGHIEPQNHGSTLLTVTDNLYEILNFDPSDPEVILETLMERWVVTISGRVLNSAQIWRS